MKTGTCVLALVVVLHAGFILAEECSPFGNQLSQTRFFSTDDDDTDRKRSVYNGPYYNGQVLDLSMTASCTGKGIAWKYCFYLDWVSSTTVQQAFFFVYRKTGDDAYTKVSGSEAVMSVYDQYSPGQWYCETISLSSPVDILKEDIIGVCLPDPIYFEPLDMFEDYSGYQLYHYSTGSVLPECSDVDVGTIDLSDDNWEATSGIALNINLEIIPTDPVMTSSTPSITPGSLPVTSSAVNPQPATSTGNLPVSSNIPHPTTSIHSLPVTSSAVNPQPATSIRSLPVTSKAVRSLPVTSSAVTPQPTTSVVVEKESDKLGSGSSSPLPSLSLGSLVGIVVGGTLVLFALPVCVLTAAYCVRKKRTQGDSRIDVVNITTVQYRKSSFSEVQVSSPSDTSAEVRLKQLEKTQFKDTDPYAEPENGTQQLFKQLKRLNITIIPTESIKKTTKALGTGHFGQVNTGIWHDSSGMITEVAVKSTMPTSAQVEKVKLLQEAALMFQFNHPNVIQLYGVIVQDNQVMLVLELARKGDLRKYLKGLRNDNVQVKTSTEFLSFSKDVAMGMYYLSRKGFVHRDIAARNMLLTATKICKVGDFGMSRDVTENVYYVSRGGEVPIRWTAPEALALKKYSAASDVWSYGCLLYEIWSVGGLPLEELEQAEILSIVESGYRMSQPPDCPREIYELMTKCWHQDPHCRPSFRDILVALLQFEESPWQRPNRDGATDMHTTPIAVPSVPETLVGRELQDRREDGEIYEEMEPTDGTTGISLEEMEEIYDDISSSTANICDKAY